MLSLVTESVKHIAVFVSRFVCVGWSVCCHHPHRSQLVDLPVFTLISVCATASEVEFVCLLVSYRPSNMRVYLRDGSAQTILRAATLR